VLAALARLLRLLTRLLLSAALLLLAGLLTAALLLATLTGPRIVLLLLVRIIGIIHKDGSLRVDVLSHPPNINLQA
jgi:hypothetical protein